MTSWIRPFKLCVDNKPDGSSLLFGGVSTCICWCAKTFISPCSGVRYRVVSESPKITAIHRTLWSLLQKGFSSLGCSFCSQPCSQPFSSSLLLPLPQPFWNMLLLTMLSLCYFPQGFLIPPEMLHSFCSFCMETYRTVTQYCKCPIQEVE